MWRRRRPADFRLMRFAGAVAPPHPLLRVDISARYPLAHLAQVHALAEAGAIRGKVVLTPGADGSGHDLP